MAGRVDHAGVRNASSGQERIMSLCARTRATGAEPDARRPAFGRRCPAQVRQKIGELLRDRRIRYTGFRTHPSIEGIAAGGRVAIMLSASELGLRMASFAMELLGPVPQVERGDWSAADYGSWTRRVCRVAAPRLIWAPTRSSAHSVSGCSDCQRARACFGRSASAAVACGPRRSAW